MKPILFPETETAFDSNGIGILSDAISCHVEEELNSQFELTMQYPITGIHADSITDRCIILAKSSPVSEPQPFRIYRINPVSRGVVTIYARHLAYDLAGIPAMPFSSESAAQAMNDMQAAAVVDCPFEFVSDISTAGAMASAVPRPIWDLMGGSTGCILDVYGGEYEFDRWKVTLHAQRGADRGVYIRYGKNLKTLEQDRNCANCWTGVYPYWVSDEGVLVTLPEKIVNAPGEYSYVKICPLDLSNEWQEAPTEDQLRERTEQYIEENQIGVPEVSWKVEYIPLDQTEEYKGLALMERVLLGDTVHVVFPQMRVNATARVVKVKFNVLLDRYDYCYLGKVRQSLADTIVKQQQAIKDTPSQTVLQQITTTLTNDILGAKGGCVRLLDTDGDGMPDTLYIADNPDPAKAVQVWRWNKAGWGGSKTGYDGPFIMGATLEHGILAEAITAANLVAGTIQSADGGRTLFIDLDNGLFDLTGKYRVFSINDADERVLGGYMGFMEGATEDGTTKGIGVCNEDGSIYIIVTTAGIRLQVGDYYLYINRAGKAATNASWTIRGDLTVTGTITSQTG